MLVDMDYINRRAEGTCDWTAGLTGAEVLGGWMQGCLWLGCQSKASGLADCVALG